MSVRLIYNHLFDPRRAPGRQDDEEAEQAGHEDGLASKLFKGMKMPKRPPSEWEHDEFLASAPGDDASIGAVVSAEESAQEDEDASMKDGEQDAIEEDFCQHDEPPARCPRRASPVPAPRVSLPTSRRKPRKPRGGKPESALWQTWDIIKEPRMRGSFMKRRLQSLLPECNHEDDELPDTDSTRMGQLKRTHSIEVEE